MSNNNSIASSAESPIFIAGSQRTGTTLLCRMLTAHPDIFVQNEILDITDRNPSPGFSKEEFFALLNAFMKKQYGLTLRIFLRNEGKNRWGLKVPQLLYHVDDLIRIFPNCRIIFTIRDGRAYANSVLKAKWGHGNIYYVAKLWAREGAIIQKMLQKYPENCLSIAFESLMLNTSDELIKIFAFIGEEFDEKVLHYHTQKSYISKEELSKNVFKKIDPTLMNRWENELSPFQINVFETVAGLTLIENGYTLKGRKVYIHPLLKTGFWLHKKVVGEIQLQRKRRLWSNKSLLQSIKQKLFMTD